MQQGHEVEEYARRIAAGLGVPDFVYRPIIATRGSRQREISDGLLVAGNDGLILQVKSRERSTGRSDSSDRALSWCRKNGETAQSQGRGTRRELAAGGVRVRSLRGFDRSLPTAADWPVVVILDHPLGPAAVFDSADDTLFISLDDWLDLHKMIRSTAGVIGYVRRALASGLAIPLGHEEQRYAQLAAADARYVSANPLSVPFLSQAPLGADDELALALFDDLVEMVADPIGGTGWDPAEYLLIVEQLDWYPVQYRVRIGAKMLATLKATIEARDRRSFIVAYGTPVRRLAFLYDYHRPSTQGDEGEFFIADLAAYGALRQAHAIAAGADPQTPTLSVGVLHSPDHGRRYAFSLYTGFPPELPRDLREALEEQYGIFIGDAVVEP